MDILKKLLGKKREVEVFDLKNNKLNIDFSSKGININGKNIALPAKVSEFEFLGKARAIECELGTNYAWDEVGVYCYTRTKNKGKVICFGIALKKGEIASATFPYELYSGVITINGKPWEEEIAKGSQTEVFTSISLGNYSVISEFCEFMNPSEYSNLEFQV